MKHNERIKINNSKARNILRGVMNVQDEPFSIIKTIEKIESLKDKKVLKQSLIYIRTSNLFCSNGLTRHFSKKFPIKLIDPMVFSENDISILIENNKIKLLELIELYCLAISFSLEENFKEAVKTINKIIENSGVSLSMLRVLYFIYNRAEYLEGYDDLLNEIDEIYDKIGINNLPDVSKGIKQIIVDRTDYFSICKKIENTDMQKSIKNILKTFISHIPIDDKNYLETLNSHLSFSLFDATVYAYTMNKIGYPSNNFNISSEINFLLDELSLKNMNVSFYKTEKEDGYDSSYFREAYLLIELEENLKYKTIHSAYYSLPNNRQRLKRRFESNLLDTYYKNINTLEDLRFNDEKKIDINFDTYNKKKSNLTENSAALSYYIDKVDGNLSHNEECIFIKLMSYTSDIAYIVDHEYFFTMKNRTKNPDFRMISLCLLLEAKNDECDLTEHEFRKRLQEVISSQHNGDIINALESFSKTSPSVAQYLVRTLDETFLSRLFNLNGTTNKALETRANILEWYGIKNSDKTAIERSKNIKIDIQIQKQMQHINDARIYADPARVIAWINDNYINKMVLALDEIIRLETPNFNYNWLKNNNSITHEAALSQMIAHCYHEFVSNGLYGVSSYLGRRIRHGTVKGNAVGGVKNILNQDTYEQLRSDPIFMNSWNEWIKNYTQIIDDLVIKYFHINQGGSTPDGFFSPSINTEFKAKTANTLVESIYNSFKKNDNASEAPAMIIDACWRLISVDLLTTKRHLYKQKEIILKFHINERENLKNSKLVHHFIKELQVLVGEKFKLIDSWFNKPSYASPSAELSMLYKVAIDEVQKKSINFEPEVIEDKSDLVIFGEVYYAIFDALEIMIKNVAEHGDKKGLLKFESKFEDDELIITTISSFSKKSLFAEAKNSIELKMASTEISNANLVDNGSGIKKLKYMVEGNQIKKIFYEYIDENEIFYINASFSIGLKNQS